MVISITSLLSFFSLLTIASAVYFLSKRLYHIPYTVLLVATGVLLVPLAQTETFSFIKDFQLTPEILFYIFLPILIFESAYAMNIRKVIENVWSISILSIVSLVISSFAIAGGLYFISRIFQFDMPFILTLLFGALISATDPVAVLALFKEYGAPRRLSLIFEGESLFNDGTAVALFLVVLEIARFGFSGFEMLADGILTFIVMVSGGILFGLIAGGIFSKLIEKTRSSEFVSITLCMVMAHTTFILAELISQNLVLFGSHIHLSPIIATTMAAMVIGNYGRYKFAPHTEEYVEKFWSHGAFVANSIIFLLIGLIFSSLELSISSFFIPIVATVIVVAIARAISIYTVIPPLNLSGLEEKIPRSWQALLSWGSLRGALAITMVYLIPDDFTLTAWNHSYSPKELLLALTLGCIFVTLFLKATTVGPMIKRLKLNSLTDMEKIEEKQSAVLVYDAALDQLEKLYKHNYVDETIYAKLRDEVESKQAESMALAKGLPQEFGSNITNRLVQMYALGIEKHFLKLLFARGEINERVYKHIFGKLNLQMEFAERGEKISDLSKHRDRKDVFENIFGYFGRFKDMFFGLSEEELYRDRLEYYRAQGIIARKVVKAFTALKVNELVPMFSEKLLDETIALYTNHQMSSKEKFQKIAEENPALAHTIKEVLARRALTSIEHETVKDLYNKEMLTPKLFITWNDQIDQEIKIVPETSAKA